MALFCEYLPSGTGDEQDNMRVLLHPTRARWILANGTFCEIARLFEAGKPFKEVSLIMADRFGIDPGSAMQDVRYVEDRLKAHHFLDEGKIPAIRTPELASVFVYVTDRCNLACSHCYYTGRSSGDLPLGSYKKMVDEMVEMGGAEITLTGGEALLHPDLKALLTYGGKRCAIRLLTNGTLLDKEWASFLSNLNDVQIQISIDGSRREIHDAIRGEGTFEKALQGIGWLQAAGLGAQLNLSTTVMARNLSDLPRIIDLAEKLGVPNVRFLPVRRKGRAESGWDAMGASVDDSDYEAFFDHVFHNRNSHASKLEVSCGLSGFILDLPDKSSSNDIWCPVGKKLVITPQGDAYPCVLLQEEEFVLGNVFREGLAQVMASDRMAYACAVLTERKEKIHECARCHWRNFCQGGCVGEALGDWGTVWERGRFCNYRKRLYEKAFTKLLKQPTSFSHGKWR